MLTTNVKSEKVRLGILGKLLGRDKAEQVTDELDNLSKTLDKLGLSRKSFEALAKKGVLEELHADIMTMLAKVTDSPSEEVASEIVALAMNKLLQPAVVEDVEEVEDMPDTEAEVIADDEMVSEEFRSRKVIKELLAQVKEGNQAVTDLATETHQIVADIGDIVKLLAPVLKDYVEAKPTLEKTKDVLARLTSLERHVKSAPRQASKDDTTLVSDTEAKSMQAKNLDDVPDMFKSAFSGGQ